MPIRTLPLALLIAGAVHLPAAQAPTPVGFRGDGSGIFPVTGVPTTWDIDKGVQLAWKAPLPERALAEPLVVGDKVLVTAEPEWLLCFDAATGQELWKAEVAAVEGLDAAAVARRREHLGKVVALWNSGADLKSPGGEAIKAEIDALKKDFGIDPLRNWLFGNLGYAAGTPVSDGVHVWARFGTGSIGCHDLATGKAAWVRKAPINSGLVVQGTQICRIDDRIYLIENLPKGQGDPKTQKQITGLEAATGKEVWHSQPIVRGDHGDGGGLVPVTVGGTTCIATSNGQIVDPKTGDIIAEGLGNCGYSTNAYALPDAICFGAARVRLQAEGGKIIAIDAPASHPKTTDAAVVFGDLAYIAKPSSLICTDPAARPAPDSKEKPQSLSYGFKQTDNAKGAPRPSVIGGLLYCPAADQNLAVVKPGAKPELVALNHLPERVCAPCAAGPGRLYVRTITTLYAIGAKPAP